MVLCPLVLQLQCIVRVFAMSTACYRSMLIIYQSMSNDTETYKLFQRFVFGRAVMFIEIPGTAVKALANHQVHLLSSQTCSLALTVLSAALHQYHSLRWITGLIILIILLHTRHS
jgi:hypothetical protein